MTLLAPGSLFHDHGVIRRFVSLLALGILLLSQAALNSIAKVASGGAPNLVVILADDLGWGDLGCYNAASRIPTPHLDRLASEGMRFTDAHSPSAVCTPTRYGLLTGRYAWRTRLRSGVLYGYSPPLLEPGQPTLASFLRDAGYRTACIGKWHLGLRFATTGGPAEFGDGSEPKVDPARIDWEQPLAEGPHTAGFHESYVIPASLDMVPYVYLRNGRAVEAPTERTPGDKSQRQGGGGFYRGGPKAPGFSIEGCQPRLTEEAESFLRRQSPAEPFFLYFPLTAPHDPWVPTADFRGTSACGPRGDFVAQVDASVGRIMRVLEERGLASNTLLVFTSDNGAHWLPGEVAATGHAANGPWRGMKSDAWEGGHRVPFLARWPGRIRAGSTSEALIGLNDLFATTAEVVGHAPPPGAAPDSVSFARALLGKPTRPRPPLVLHSIRGEFVLRDGPWKLIDGPDGGGWTAGKATEPGQLHDLRRDAGETNNLWRMEPKRVREMQDALARIRGVPREKPERPNIIVVMTDDQGYGELSCHGNPILATPNLDRLHAQSARFVDYTVSPTCAPTRAALLTGRHEFRSGITHTIYERERLDLKAVTLPELLKSAGYGTGIFGKWHLGDERRYLPDRRGFDEVYIHGGGGIGQTYPGSCGDAPGNGYHDPVLLHNGRFVKTRGYCTDLFFGEALRWIDVQRQSGRPFFAYITPNAPHMPHVTPGPEYDRLFEGRGLSASDVRYYAMIRNIDDNVGRLLDRLGEWGLDENTLVIFQTDNGHSVSGVYNAGMRAMKGTPYQGGIRVPSFWRWKGHIAPGDRPQMAAHLDVLPTLVELAGARMTDQQASRLEGMSLVPALRSAAAPWPERVLVTHLGRWPHGKAEENKLRGSAIRRGRFKLVHGTELYDLVADPAEKNDLAATKPEIVRELGGLYDRWWAEVRPATVANENHRGPTVNPFKARYWKQYGGGPSESLLAEMDPEKKFAPPAPAPTSRERRQP